MENACVIKWNENTGPKTVWIYYNLKYRQRKQNIKENSEELNAHVDYSRTTGSSLSYFYRVYSIVVQLFRWNKRWNKSPYLPETGDASVILRLLYVVPRRPMSQAAHKRPVNNVPNQTLFGLCSTLIARCQTTHSSLACFLFSFDDTGNRTLDI